MTETPELTDPHPTGMWLHKHDHVWEYSGAHRARTYNAKTDDFTGPFSPWWPVFTCTHCGDAVYDSRRTVGPAVT